MVRLAKNVAAFLFLMTVSVALTAAIAAIAFG